MDSTSAPSKDEFICVMAIDNNCIGYVSMYKKGDLTKPKPTVYQGLDYKKKGSGRNKEKKDHIKKLIELLKEDFLFNRNVGHVKIQGLVVAACDNYGDDLEKLVKYLNIKPQFFQLPPDSKDPFADAILASQESIQESKFDRGPGISNNAEKDSTPLGTSSTHNTGTPQGFVVNAAKIKLEGDSKISPGKKRDSIQQDTACNHISGTAQDSTQQDTSSNHSSGTAQERRSVSSADSADFGPSGSAIASTKVAHPDTFNRKTSVVSITSKHEEKGPTGGDVMLIMEAIAKLSSKIDLQGEEMRSKINELKQVINGQDRSSTAKGKAPPRPPGYSPSSELTPSLLYNLHPAPSKVSKIEQQFCDRLKKKISSDKKQLQEEVTGPSVVFAINSSRIQADIQRDLKSITFTGPTLLMIIHPTRDPDRAPPRLLADDLAGFPVEGRDCHYLLVDNNNTALHDCGVNSDTVDAVARFITKNQKAVN